MLKMRIVCCALFIFPVLRCYSQSGDWSTQSFDAGILYDVVFVDSLHGWTVGTGGKIYASTDGGQTWGEQIHVTSSNLSGVSFVDTSSGYAVGDGGTVLKTTDGGNSWGVQTTTPAYNWSKVHFRTSTNGWLVGLAAVGIRQTTDGGLNWELVSSTGQFFGLWFLPQSVHGWAVGNVGLRGTVDGTNWVDLNSSSNPSGVSFPNDSVGYEIDAYAGVGSTIESRISKSTNGGNTWTPLDTLTNTYLQGVTFVDTLEGWVTGWSCVPATNCTLDGGCIYHTTDGGLTWTQEVFTPSTLYYQIYLIDKNNGWAVGGIPAGAQVVARFHRTLSGVTDGRGRLSSSFSLAQNYPNPFNPTTEIQYDIPRSAYVSLKVYDVFGREIASLVNERKQAGAYLVKWDASKFASSVYYYRIIAGDFISTKKMVLAK